MILRISYDSSMMNTARTPLEVGMSDLAIGKYSVGLAPSRTAEHLVEAFLDLIGLVRQDDPEFLRDEDIVMMADATGIDAQFLRNRVNNHLAAATRYCA